MKASQTYFEPGVCETCPLEVIEDNQTFEGAKYARDLITRGIYRSPMDIRQEDALAEDTDKPIADCLRARRRGSCALMSEEVTV